MAVKIDMQETVPPHVAIAGGLGGKAILLINGEFRAEPTRIINTLQCVVSILARPRQTDATDCTRASIVQIQLFGGVRINF